MFKGFDRRLNTNLQRICNERQEVSNKKNNQNAEPIKTTVSQNLVQGYAVWFGGSMLSCEPHFESIVKTRAMYQEHGPSICRHNPVFNS
jgi:actin-related protein 3